MEITGLSTCNTRHADQNYEEKSLGCINGIKGLQKLDRVTTLVADSFCANFTTYPDTHPISDTTVNLIFGCINNRRSFITRSTYVTCTNLLCSNFCTNHAVYKSIEIWVALSTGQNMSKIRSSTQTV